MIEVEGLDTKGEAVEVKGVYEEDASTLWVSINMLGLVRLKLDFNGGHIRVINQEIKTITRGKGDVYLVFSPWLIKAILYYGLVIGERDLSDII